MSCAHLYIHICCLLSPLADEDEEEDAAGPGKENNHRGAPRVRGGPRRLLAWPLVPSPPKPPALLQLERHVVRPPPASPEPDALPLASGAPHVLRRHAWLRVFRHLSARELCVCMRVCRTWSRWSAPAWGEGVGIMGAVGGRGGSCWAVGVGRGVRGLWGLGGLGRGGEGVWRSRGDWSGWGGGVWGL